MYSIKLDQCSTQSKTLFPPGDRVDTRGTGSATASPSLMRRIALENSMASSRLGKAGAKVPTSA